MKNAFYKPGAFLPCSRGVVKALEDRQETLSLEHNMENDGIRNTRS